MSRGGQFLLALMLAACGQDQAPLTPRRGDCQIFCAMELGAEIARDDRWDFFARYDLVLASRTPGTVAPLRARNPKVIVLANVNPYFALGPRFWPDHVLDPERVEPSWVLRDRRGQPIKYRGPLYPGMDPQHLATMMDVRVPAWQTAFADWVAQVVSEQSLDGVFLDTLSLGYPEFALAADGSKCADFAEQPWARAAHDLIARFRDAMPAAGKIVFNGLSVAPGGALTAGGLSGDAALLGPTDGACYEAFSIAWPLDHNDDTKRWYFTHAISTAMVQTRKQDKFFLLQVTGAADDAQLRLYALCAFLLHKHARSFFYYAPNEDAPAWYPEWETELGAPLGEAHADDGIFVREYAKVTVRVNPTAQTRGSQNPLPPFSGQLVPRR